MITKELILQPTVANIDNHPASQSFMDIVFNTKKLEKLYTERKGEQKYPKEVVNAFFEVTAIIRNAHDERDLRPPNNQGWNLETMKTGKFKGKLSLRLNNQWRLITTFEQDELGKYVLIHDITNHYK